MIKIELAEDVMGPKNHTWNMSVNISGEQRVQAEWKRFYEERTFKQNSSFPYNEAGIFSPLGMSFPSMADTWQRDIFLVTFQKDYIEGLGYINCPIRNLYLDFFWEIQGIKQGRIVHSCWGKPRSNLAWRLPPTQAVQGLPLSFQGNVTWISLGYTFLTPVDV